MAITSVCTFTISCRHTRTARWEIIPSLCPALPICPARIPPRSPHQPAHSFHFDAFALSLDSGRRPAHVHPLSLIRVSGRLESRNFKDNKPVIVSLLTGGGGRDVDRTGGRRHTHQTTHIWYKWRARQLRTRPIGVGVRWWAMIVDSGCEGCKPHPPTGSTSLVHGSEGCSAVCVGAGGWGIVHTHEPTCNT